MDIIIIGCGKLGMELTQRLTAEGHDITVVDEDVKQVQTVVSMYDAQGIEGNGASYKVLQEAGVESADLLIAVTNSDELNLLCCLIAKRSSNCPTIARVRNPVYREEIQFIKEGLGLDMIINPEFESASEISRILRRKSVLDINPFAKGRVELMRFRIPENSILDQRQIVSIAMRLKADVLVTAVERENKVTIPSGGFELHSGDIVTILATPRNASDFFEKIGLADNAARTCIIVGGGMHGFYLATELLNTGTNVKIIEKSAARCDELSILLPKAVVINADGTDENVLLEQGLDYSDSFVALTNRDEENILLSLYAIQNSDTKVVTKLNRVNFDSVVEKMDLGTVIYPKSITADSIIRYVRARNNSKDASEVETMYRIIGNRVEALEFIIKEPSFITDERLVDLKIKNNTLVGCITRDGQSFIPRGKDTIQVGDSVVIITTIQGVGTIQGFFNK
ncbi:MAG: Trk system potassium transporter TrkA [Firmicutes bacterium]|nr:Trk system potassium transporter TrkA [Bacillota bacterium]